MRIVSDGEGFDYYLQILLIIVGLVIYLIIEHYFPYPLSILVLVGVICIPISLLALWLRWKPKKPKSIPPELMKTLKDKGFRFEDEEE